MERRASGREAGLGHSGSSVVGGLAGRLGMESLELGKRRGLLQGLRVGPAWHQRWMYRWEQWDRPGP